MEETGTTFFANILYNKSIWMSSTARLKIKFAYLLIEGTATATFFINEFKRGIVTLSNGISFCGVAKKANVHGYLTGILYVIIFNFP